VAKLMILTSPDVVAPAGTVYRPIVDALKKQKAAGNPVAVVSNHPAPPWFAAAFAGSSVQFLQEIGRQDGKIIAANAQRMNLPAQDTIVLAANQADMRMGKNGDAVLIAANWCADSYVRTLGIDVLDAKEFEEALALCDGWNAAWWYEGNQPHYAVRALADLSSKNATSPQRDFSAKITAVVKGGGPQLKSMLVTACRSLLASGFQHGDTLWSVYPSSRVTSGDSEVLSNFTHRLRTTVSNMRLARVDEPLFLRHTRSTKRSAGASWVPRTDPSEQLLTIHLNPRYRKNIKGRHVIVVDDVTTYGLSFGVAAALLRRAGAAQVTGIALGKFGNPIKYYEIDVSGDVFAPLQAGSFSVKLEQPFGGTSNPLAQNTLRSLLV